MAIRLVTATGLSFSFLKSCAGRRLLLAHDPFPERPMVKPIPHSDDQKRVVVYMSPKLHASLITACRLSGQNVSSWVRIAAEEKIAHERRARKPQPRT